MDETATTPSGEEVTIVEGSERPKQVIGQITLNYSSMLSDEENAQLNGGPSSAGLKTGPGRFAHLGKTGIRPPSK